MLKDDLITLDALEDWLEMRGPPGATERLKQLRADMNHAVEEIIRLRAVISEHVSATSRIVTSNMNSDLRTETEPQLLLRETRLRLTPQLWEIRVPWDLATWSPNHKHAFVSSTASALGEKAARLIAKDIWPNAPIPKN